MSAEITISRNGQTLGPYAPDEVERRLEDGTITRDNLAWTEGMTEWRPLHEIADIEVVDTDGEVPETSQSAVTGEGPETIPCPMCETRGTVKCSQCDGQGTPTCPHCHGWGERTIFDDSKRQHREQCLACRGTGRLDEPCSKCDGKREIECPVCLGKLRVSPGRARLYEIALESVKAERRRKRIGCALAICLPLLVIAYFWLKAEGFDLLKIGWIAFVVCAIVVTIVGWFQRYPRRSLAVAGGIAVVMGLPWLFYLKLEGDLGRYPASRTEDISNKAVNPPSATKASAPADQTVFPFEKLGGTWEYRGDDLVSLNPAGEMVRLWARVTIPQNANGKISLLTAKAGTDAWSGQTDYPVRMQPYTLPEGKGTVPSLKVDSLHTLLGIGEKGGHVYLERWRSGATFPVVELTRVENKPGS